MTNRDSFAFVRGFWVRGVDGAGLGGIEPGRRPAFLRFLYSRMRSPQSVAMFA